MDQDLSSSQYLKSKPNDETQSQKDNIDVAEKQYGKYYPTLTNPGLATNIHIQYVSK